MMPWFARPWASTAASALSAFLLFSAVRFCGAVSDNLASVLARFDEPPVPRLVILDRGGGVLYSRTEDPARYAVTDPAGLPRPFTDILLLSEDRRFREHGGVDLRGLARALFSNAVEEDGTQGGSTITMQLVKLKLGESRRSLGNKLEQMATALLLEGRKGKDEILAAYCNCVFMGYSLYGMENASRYYLGKPLAELDGAECAFLAAILPRPAVAMEGRMARLLTLQKSLLRQAAERNLVAPREAEEALDRFLSSYALPKAQPETLLAVEDRFPYLSDHVKSLLESGAMGDLAGLSLEVRTTFDAAAQEQVQTALSDYIVTALFRNLSSMQDPPLQGAAVALDAGDGSLRALVGGRGYSRGDQFNRATGAVRKVGSAFKPFLYALAFEDLGLGPESEESDEPVSVWDDLRGAYGPENHYHGYQGQVTLREALAQSINTVSLRVAGRVGLRRMIEGTARFFTGTGLSPGEAEARYEASWSTALGSARFSILELTSAYGAFANGGMLADAWCIQEVRRGGAAVFRREPAPPRRVVDAGTARGITACLSAVFELDGTAFSSEDRLPFPVSGKSGSIEDNAWFVGYSSGLVLGVWLGLDQRAGVARDVHWKAYPVFRDAMMRIRGPGS